MSEQQVLMVAERAVRQQIDDLRGELGVKFYDIDKGMENLKIVIKGEFDNEIQEVQAAVTDAFKNNNATFRDQLNAMKGDIAQELTKKIEVKARENQDAIQNHSRTY